MVRVIYDKVFTSPIIFHISTSFFFNPGGIHGENIEFKAKNISGDGKDNVIIKNC
jgi:hypothetical protein